MKKIEIFWLTVFFIFIVTLVSYPIITPRDVLVKEDIEYLYYKEYSWWGLDSCVYKYHKPIIYKGKVIDKYTRSHFAGVPGKGGHYVKNYHVVFKFDNKTWQQEVFKVKLTKISLLLSDKAKSVYNNWKSKKLGMTMLFLVFFFQILNLSLLVNFQNNQ